MGPWRREIALKYNTLQYYLSVSSGDNNSMHPTDHFATVIRVWDILHWSWDFSLVPRDPLFLNDRRTLAGAVWSLGLIWARLLLILGAFNILFTLHKEYNQHLTAIQANYLFNILDILNERKHIYFNRYTINTSQKSLSMVFSVTCLGHFI